MFASSLFLNVQPLSRLVQVTRVHSHLGRTHVNLFSPDKLSFYTLYTIILSWSSSNSKIAIYLGWKKNKSTLHFLFTNFLVGLTFKNWLFCHQKDQRFHLLCFSNIQFFSHWHLLPLGKDKMLVKYFLIYKIQDIRSIYLYRANNHISGFYYLLRGSKPQ